MSVYVILFYNSTHFGNMRDFPHRYKTSIYVIYAPDTIAIIMLFSYYRNTLNIR